VVNSAGGQPGKAPTISIRGAGTPMYVIDGVISDEYAFSSINPSDIDQISFLKDASSTAVYGSRAGDGIVLVKQKR
jgi:TonB-dependent outer membrane receptor, SusC/RagA subfamily, signature region